MENSSMLKGSMVRLMHTPKCNLLTLALSQRVFSQLWKKKKILKSFLKKTIVFE